MQNKFTTSTNIIRDSNRSLNYIPTPNAVKVVNQISNDFKKGIRSFNIIGSYGTGKSTFLWAFQQSISTRKRIFDINIIQSPKTEIINFVGEYKSITSAFAEFFEISTTKHTTENILSEIFNKYHELGKKNPLLIITIDEFGKYLEFAAQNSPEKELYFIQQLSEFCNNPDHNILLITTVHQNFDAYSFSLNTAQKQEWTKVKGRFREITFNEPVEQLLFLAAEHLKKNRYKKNDSEIKSAALLARKSRVFQINNNFASEVADKLYPLDLVTAYLLTLALQRYGQNERSLFSFLESTDNTGVNNYNSSSNPFYNASCVYDYLIYNFYSYINSRYNPDFAAWSAIKNCLEEAERLFDKDLNAYSKIIKTIGLLNVFAAPGSDLGKEFLIKYAKTCLGVKEAESIISDLEKKKLILYRNYSKRYILFEGTDLDITSALIAAGNKVSEINDVATLLNRYYQLPPVIAKSYSYLNGTPRLFEFRISEHPISELPHNEIDGFINLIFNERLSLQEVKSVSAAEHEAIIYAYYQKPKAIKDLLFEIEKIRKVIEENDDDKVAVKELKAILTHQQNLLNHFILHNLYSKKSDIVWIYDGKEIKIQSKRDLNKFLSEICNRVYDQTPVFRNELVNKHRISSAVSSARKNFLKGLINNWNLPDLGFPADKFPPEKTIFLTLLKENGISLYSEKINFVTQISKKSTFYPLWNASIEFLNSSKKSRRKLSDFVEVLGKRPFKLKQGLIDFWVPVFLFIKRDDFALFGEKGYLPYLTDDILELLTRYPENYEIKTFDIEGVKLDIFNSYRLLLNKDSKERFDNHTFIDTIKPFLTCYKNLSEYSKHTKRLKKETLAVRQAISHSKDPEKSFFEDFPLALGYSIDTLPKGKNLQNYINDLQNAIRELRTSYDNLLTRFEEYILNEFIGDECSFEEYKIRLQERYKTLKKHLCLPHQKVFVQRLDSQLDDRNAWLSSLAQAVLNKSLETIKDEDEIILYDKFNIMILELDSLTNLSNADFEADKEEVLGIQISSFVDGIKNSLIRFPKTKSKEIEKVEESIRPYLSRNKSINLLALTNILKELLQNDKS
jgi:hypothetical protein